MDRLFITVLNMSITASCVLLVVLVLRLILQRMKVPKWMVCLLWIAVFFRLLCPVALTSEYSLLQYVPRREGVVQSGTQMEYITPDVYVQQLPSVAKQTDVVAEPSVVQPTQEMERVAGYDETGSVGFIMLLPVFWFIGVLLFAAYSGWRWYGLRQRVATATRVADNIYESDRVASPFVMGLLRPKIYLPLGLAGETREYIVLHEQSHIRRGDLWWKAIAQIALILHWFNPLVYGAYYLLGQDLEQACDEKVVACLGSACKADYSRTLLAMSVANRHLLTPLAFGESRTKQRVKNILQYARPTAEALLVWVIIGIMVAVSCLSNPIAPSSEENLYQQESRQSIFYQDYYLDLQPDLQAVYEILWPDNPLQLRQMIAYHPKGTLYSVTGYDAREEIVQNPEERSGSFQFSTNRYLAFQQHKQQMEQYMRVAMALLQIERADAMVTYRRSEQTDVGQYLDVALTLTDAPQNQMELQQLLEAWGIERAEERAAQLWPIGETMRRREQQMLEVQEAFPFYDMICCGALSYNFSLPEPGTYSVQFTVDERDAYLREREKTRLDYEKSAILLFAQYPQLVDVEFCFLGQSFIWGTSFTNETLHFSRSELEQQCGSLALLADKTVTEQVQPWFARAEAFGVPEPYGQPQMDFYEKLRRMEWYYDTEKTDAHYASGEEYNSLRFSLLPNQSPVDGGCYLQMEFVKPWEEPAAEQSVSSVWIYGKQAQWQELIAPTVTETERYEYAARWEILCSGYYRIVVSRWDMELRKALEALGGQVAAEQAAPWTVIYEGRLTFQQEI